MDTRIRGEALTGKGYGELRYQLFKNARCQIESSLLNGYYCEAIAICESVISDRLESRLSYLSQKNVGFQTLGKLIGDLKKVETDDEIRTILNELDRWRIKRNRALHELVKVEDAPNQLDWAQRMDALDVDAVCGYKLLCWLYNRVADLNPLHPDRVFERVPISWGSGICKITFQFVRVHAYCR